MKLSIFKYWFKLIRSDNCVLKACHKDMISRRNDSWIRNIEQELSKLVFLFDGKTLNNATNINIIQQRINDVYMQNIFLRYHSTVKESFINTLQTDVFCSQTCQKQLISIIEKK